MKTEPNEPYVFPQDAGVHDLWFPYPGAFVGRYSIKATAEQTRGRLSQVHIIDDRGAASPVHIHPGYDETYYLIDGKISFFLGDERVEAETGAFTMIPQGVPHAFLIQSERAEFLITFAPAGLEKFFVEVGLPILPGQVKPTAIPTDPEAMARRAAAYGADIVGPPPALE